MGCNDLCTAAKCAELEQQINELQFQINATHNLLQQHLFKNIPDAHSIETDFSLEMQLDEKELTTEITLFGQLQSSTVTLPDSVVPTVAVEVLQQDSYNHQIQLTVNDVSDTAILTTHQPQVELGVAEINEGEWGIGLIYDGVESGGIIKLPEVEQNETIDLAPEFSVDVSYLFNLLTVSVTIEGQKRSDTVYIDADVINRYGGGGGGLNQGEEDMGCQQIADELKIDLSEIIQAIAAVDAKVSQVKEEVTIEVDAKALSEFDCPEAASDGNGEDKVYQLKPYKMPTLPALHNLLHYINRNQAAIFEHLCQGNNVLAMPAFYQVRLGGNVPQLACVFRKGGSSTYHTLNIPHPANTDKPTSAVLPAYTKGSWQGIITCRDNSKFIINCNTKAEVERMCGIAAQLIDSAYLELPPRIYVGERKGQAVFVDPMIPTSIEYFESGQKHTVPNWRVRVADLD